MSTVKTNKIGLRTSNMKSLRAGANRSDIHTITQESVGTATTETYETFTSDTTWTSPAGLTEVTVIAVGGGGGGGYNVGGGGGGGAINTVDFTIAAQTNYDIEVGVGGVAGQNNGNTNGGTGSRSTFNSVAVAGGGGGGGSGVASGNSCDAPTVPNNCTRGGSGGGGVYNGANAGGAAESVSTNQGKKGGDASGNTAGGGGGYANAFLGLGLKATTGGLLSETGEETTGMGGGGVRSTAIVPNTVISRTIGAGGSGASSDATVFNCRFDPNSSSANGGSTGTAPTTPEANSGNGGGGGGPSSQGGTAGADGVVVLRYNTASTTKTAQPNLNDSENFLVDVSGDVLIKRPIVKDSSVDNQDKGHGVSGSIFIKYTSADVVTLDGSYVFKDGGSYAPNPTAGSIDRIDYIIRDPFNIQCNVSYNIGN